MSDDARYIPRLSKSDLELIERIELKFRSALQRPTQFEIEPELD